MLHELIGSLRGQGFRRILLVNGHGGNGQAAETLVSDGVALHDWWCAPRTLAAVRELDPDASHASWMENFAWTRLPGIELPPGPKLSGLPGSDDPAEVTRRLGDCCYYARPEEDLLCVWTLGVEETREALVSLSAS